ncbi:MAG: hypothetical protein OCU12_06380 [Methanophagales archaeon]|nr:hypothetical protein [Methanophagales archaeon]
MASVVLLTAITISVATLPPGFMSAVPLYSEEKVAAYYAPGVMESVAERRGLSLEGYVDGVAIISDDPLWLGREVFIVYDGRAEGPFLVVDIAWKHDLPKLRSYNEGIEVGYRTAERWGRAGGGRFGPVFVYVVPTESLP